MEAAAIGDRLNNPPLHRTRPAGMMVARREPVRCRPCPSAALSQVPQMKHDFATSTDKAADERFRAWLEADSIGSCTLV